MKNKRKFRAAGNSLYETLLDSSEVGPNISQSVIKSEEISEQLELMEEYLRASAWK